MENQQLTAGQAIDAVNQGNVVRCELWKDGEKLRLFRPKVQDENPKVISYFEAFKDGFYQPYQLTHAELQSTWVIVND